MSNENSFRLTKAHLIGKDKGFSEDCVKTILDKPEFKNTDKVLTIEDVENNKLYLYPLPPDKLPILVRLNAATRKDLDDSLKNLRIYLKQLALIAIFDSGICPRKEDCHWMGYFWIAPDRVPELDKIKKELKPAKMEADILE